MTHSGPHHGDLRGREAALAAFDRCDDRRSHARLAAEHRPEEGEVRDREPRLLTHVRFEHDALGLDVWVRARGGLRCLSGLVEGARAPARVQVRGTERTHARRVALDGSFEVEEIEPGPVSLVVRHGDDATVVTDWFTL